MARAPKTTLITTTTAEMEEVRAFCFQEGVEHAVRAVRAHPGVGPGLSALLDKVLDEANRKLSLAAERAVGPSTARLRGEQAKR